jgi:hypothetical protein
MISDELPHVKGGVKSFIYDEYTVNLSLELS